MQRSDAEVELSSLEISQLLGNYGEFLGALAILVTLVYLSIQIRANTTSTRSLTLLEVGAQYQALLQAPADCPELVSALEKSHRREDLSAAERIVLSGWYDAMANLLIRTWRQAEMGVFPTGEVHEGLKDGIRVFLAIPSIGSFVDSADPHTSSNKTSRGTTTSCAKSACQLQKFSKRRRSFTEFHVVCRQDSPGAHDPVAKNRQ